MARIAIDAGIVPDTLGADMHGYNTEIPEVKKPAGTPDEHHDDENHPFLGQARFSLTQAMSSMMALGIPLEDVVPMVTSHPAEMLRMSDRIGALKVGYTADISVLHDDRGRFLLRVRRRVDPLVLGFVLLEQRVALFGEVQRRPGIDRGEQTLIEVDVGGLAGFVDRDLARDKKVVAAARHRDVGVGQAAQLERRVVSDALRRELDV